MLSKIWNVKLLRIVLGVTFLVGLLPISDHMLTMQAMHIETSESLSSTEQEKQDPSPMGSCCEAIGSLLLTCDFLAVQLAYIGSIWGGKQFPYSVPIVQLIYIKSLAPPPKA
jgi:hypothetical protein